MVYFDREGRVGPATREEQAVKQRILVCVALFFLLILAVWMTGRVQLLMSPGPGSFAAVMDAGPIEPNGGWWWHEWGGLVERMCFGLDAALAIALVVAMVKTVRSTKG